jgi:hypothetical protein
MVYLKLSVHHDLNRTCQTVQFATLAKLTFERVFTPAMPEHY